MVASWRTGRVHQLAMGSWQGALAIYACSPKLLTFVNTPDKQTLPLIVG